MPPPEFERPDSKGNILFMLACIALVCGGILAGIFVWVKAQKPAVQKSPAKLENIRALVHFEGPYVILRNQNSFSWDNEMLVYVGAAPPTGFSHPLGIVYPGDTISLALNEFVNGSGEKFSAYGLGITEAWVGGKEYAVQNFHDAGANEFYGAASVVRK